MSQTITLFHNPRCSKSRGALELLTARGANVEVVEYLKTPPSRATLAALVAKLGIDAGDLIRRGRMSSRRSTRAARSRTTKRSTRWRSIRS